MKFEALKYQHLFHMIIIISNKTYNKPPKSTIIQEILSQSLVNNDVEMDNYANLWNEEKTIKNRFEWFLTSQQA